MSTSHSALGSCPPLKRLQLVFQNRKWLETLPDSSLQDFWKRLLAHCVLARGLQKEKDTLTKPCQGNVVHQQAKGQTAVRAAVSLSRAEHSRVSSRKQGENQSLSNLQVQKFKSGQKKKVNFCLFLLISQQSAFFYYVDHISLFFSMPTTLDI